MSDEGITIEPVAIPSSLDAADAADFLAMVDVRNAVARERSGHDGLGYSAEELLPGWQNDEDVEGHAWLVRRDGRAIGRLFVEFPQEDGSQVSEIAIELLADAWDPAIAVAGLRLVEDETRARGRSIIRGWTMHRPDPSAGQLAAPTGFGRIPQDGYAQAYLDAGFTLEQVERNSVLDLHGDWSLIQRLHDEAAAAASDAYRLESWTLPTPDAYVDAYAMMMGRMSTDAPSADMEFDEEVWDAARLRRYEHEQLDGGRFGNVVAARHVASGDLVAFNELFIDAARTGTTEQNATLVLKEHRGHRLGMLVKAANLLAWRDLAPLSPRVSTFNAEENRPMLDINEALGFVPASYSGGWQKRLEA